MGSSRRQGPERLLWLPAPASDAQSGLRAECGRDVSPAVSCVVVPGFWVPTQLSRFLLRKYV